MKRPLASALSALLVLMTPGLSAYEAAAQTVRGGGATGATGEAGTVGTQTPGVGANAALPAVSLSPLGLSPALSAGAAPAVSAIPSLVPAQAPATVVAGLGAAPALAAPSGVAGFATTAAGAKAPANSSVLAPASRSAAAKTPASTAEALKASAAEISAAAKAGDASGALAKAFENGSARAELGAVAPAGSAPALRGSLLKKGAAAAPNQKPEAVPAAAAPAAKTGFLQKLKATFDLSEFSKSEKAYIAGQAVFLFAISVYLASLPLLVKAITGDAAMTGVARMVHYWVFGGASLFAGAVVAKSPMKRILVGAAGARAAIFGTIGVLALFGGLPWMGLLALVGVNALIVAHNHLVDIDTGGAAKIFKGKDQKQTDDKIEQAGYVYDYIYYGMMLFVPALIGIPMDWLDARFGAGIGAAAGFSLFAALMATVAWIYAKKVHTIGDLATIPLKGVRDAFARSWASTKTFFGILKDIPGRNWRALKVVWANQALRARWSMATVENFVEDALFAVVLPTFALEILGVGAFGNGLLLGAITGGGLVASMFMRTRAKALQEKYGTAAFLTALTAVAALAFVPSAGLWLFPSLALAVPAVFALKLMLQPLRSRMRALLQTEIKNDPKAAAVSDDIYSLMTAIEVVAAGAGGLAFAWLFSAGAAASPLVLALGAMAPMKVVTIAMVGMGLVYWLGLRWVKRQLNRPVLRVHKSPEGNEAKMLERLATSLQENGLPPYKTAKAAGPADDGEPVVAILAPSSRHKVAIAREGGKQGPGLVNLVLDAGWLIQETYPDGKTKLLVTKGVVFDEKGQATVVEYETPRRVRYFANYFTLGANDRDDGVVFEKNLDVPQSNSLSLEKFVNDKLGTRLILAAKGVAVPATLALLMPLHHLAGQGVQGSRGVQVVDMPAAASREAEVARLVDEYLANFEGEELVVKPSGPQFHSGRGVKFFKKSERDAIVAHALALSTDPQMTEDGAVLLDERVNSAPLKRGERKMETTLRVLAARAPWGKGVTTGVFARVGPWGKPTTAEAADPRDNATVDPWESLLAEWKAAGLLDERGVRELDERTRAMGAAALDAIAAYEKTYPAAADGSLQAQTDLIGLDVMIERRGDRLVPVVIEVNDHDSGGQYNLDQMQPSRAGEHSREWVATMLQRARRDALKGKRIALVGAGYSGKRFIFERAKELGVKVVLVDKRGPFVDELIRDGLVSELIETDNSKPKEALAAAKAKLLRSARKNGKIDAVTSFWEDDVPLTADLAQALGLPYHTQEAAKSVRSKAVTRAVMEKAGLPTPRNRKIALPVKPSAADAKMTAAYEVAVQSARERFLKDLDFVGFPAVLKPAFGAAAMGVKKVTSKAEAMAAFDEIRAVVTPEVDPIFAQGADLVLEQYLDGREYDVDIVMRGGKALFVSVTDNWPTREPYFLATGSSLPSRQLSATEQAEAGDLAVKTAQALGLTDGVIHIEGKYTKDGARIIEANGRMGGEYVHDWVEAVWGVSLVEENLMAAAGIPGTPFKAAVPRAHLEGEFIIPTQSGVVAAFALPDEAREQPGFHELRVKKRVGDRIAVPPAGYERAGMLTARGATTAEARANLDALRAQLLLDIKPQ